MGGTTTAVVAASPAALGRRRSDESFTPVALGLASLSSSPNRRERQGRREKWDGDGGVRDGVQTAVRTAYGWRMDGDVW
ncbi:hypothetical protein NL676_014394 [Syzygium grande]|nr:hypothetical protein NL676_014394 [Syzygium grande]